MPAASPTTVNTRSEPRATRVVVGALGALAGAAGIEHGIGEILQGSVRPDGVLIMSWPDAAALEVLSGEPAMTVIPDLRVAGVLTVFVSLIVIVWSIWFTDRRHGLGLIGLSVLLLLVGGGIAPPIMGMTLGLVAARIGSTPETSPGSFQQRVAPAWPWFLALALAGYLGLMPGILLADAWGVASETLVIALGVLAFSGFGLALTAARAHDRLHTTTRGVST